MKNITIIVPVHEYSDELSKFYQNALSSVPSNDENYSVTVVGPKAVLKEYEKIQITYEGRINFLENEVSDFCSQINAAAKSCQTDYFSILEVDDSYTKIWFKNVQEHLEALQDVSVFLPVTEVYDLSSGEKVPVGLANEIGLSAAYSDNIGYLSIDALKDYSDFNLTGSVFKTTDFVTVGGLKPSIKIAFWTEFLLRALNNSKKAYIIPKIGYQHGMNRKGSLVEKYSGLSEEEAKWYLDLAQKEYFFKEDRKKTFSPKN